MYIDEFDDEFDEDEFAHSFKTKEQRTRLQHAKHQEEFRKRHGLKKFVADFKKDEGLDEILERLRKDGVTNKEFIIKSFERYERDGGFNED